MKQKGDKGSVSGLYLIGKTCLVTERKLFDTVREGMLLSASLLLVLLHVIKATPAPRNSIRQL